MEEFEGCFRKASRLATPEEGTVVRGKVLAIENGQAIVDIGFKMEGRVDSRNSRSPGQTPI
jgi:small subunit ribosomal protein S1